MSYFLILLPTLLFAIVGYLRYKYSYWHLRGVKQLKTNFLLGNFRQTRTVHLSELQQAVYAEFKGKAKLAGAYVFLKPVVVALDLDLVKTILIKDFSNFVDRSDYKNLEYDPLSSHLFNLYAEKWRILRSKLSPTFTTGKMKCMFPIVVDVAQRFQAAMEKALQQSPDKVLEIYDFMGRYTTDVIGSCVFGIECNSLLEPDNEFRRMGKLIFKPHGTSPRLRLFLFTFSKYLKYIHGRRISREVEDFLRRLLVEAVAQREKEHIKRKDFLNLLIELKNSVDANGLPLLTQLEMVAQVFVFFGAGFETSSSNLTCGLYELAKHSEIQEKVRQEIKQVLAKHNELVTYEAMLEMTYLDQVVSETVRKYPALAGLSRYVGADYKVPDTDITLEKGTQILIPALAIHHDPDIYENPEEFRPERFTAEEIQKRHPQSFLGFGDGPRNCIGVRFARMEVRVGLITLLKSFKFSVCDKTPKSIKASDFGFLLIPGEKVCLKVEAL